MSGSSTAAADSAATSYYNLLSLSVSYSGYLQATYYPDQSIYISSQNHFRHNEEISDVDVTDGDRRAALDAAKYCADRMELGDFKLSGGHDCLRTLNDSFGVTIGGGAGGAYSQTHDVNFEAKRVGTIYRSAFGWMDMYEIRDIYVDDNADCAPGFSVIEYEAGDVWWCLGSQRREPPLSNKRMAITDDDGTHAITLVEFDAGLVTLGKATGTVRVNHLCVATVSTSGRLMSAIEVGCPCKCIRDGRDGGVVAADECRHMPKTPGAGYYVWARVLGRRRHGARAIYLPGWRVAIVRGMEVARAVRHVMAGRLRRTDGSLRRGWWGSSADHRKAVLRGLLSTATAVLTIVTRGVKGKSVIYLGDQIPQALADITLKVCSCWEVSIVINALGQVMIVEDLWCETIRMVRVTAVPWYERQWWAEASYRRGVKRIRGCDEEATVDNAG